MPERVKAIKFARGSKKYDKSSHDNTAEANFTVLKIYGPGVQLKCLLVQI